MLPLEEGGLGFTGFIVIISHGRPQNCSHGGRKKGPESKPSQVPAASNTETLQNHWVSGTHQAPGTGALQCPQ